MTRDSIPLLYSFRRCPYAIRARMAVWSAGIPVQLEEVALKDKPQAMLELSSKGTVPVLVDGDAVIDESLDVMRWALKQNDPDNWYADLTEAELSKSLALIAENDSDFKHWLDRYKYADRHPEHSEEYYRSQGEVFLEKLEAILQQRSYLIRDEMTFADIAIFPFIRQFSMVDKEWFEQSSYPAVNAWLAFLLDLPLFGRVMQKHRGH
ncbi:MAG: glutathione S-transferase [Gammaproteobacteria bacterium]